MSASLVFAWQLHLFAREAIWVRWLGFPVLPKSKLGRCTSSINLNWGGGGFASGDVYATVTQRNLREVGMYTPILYIYIYIYTSSHPLLCDMRRTSSQYSPCHRSRLSRKSVRTYMLRRCIPTCLRLQLYLLQVCILDAFLLQCLAEVCTPVGHACHRCPLSRKSVRTHMEEFFNQNRQP